MVTQGLSHTLSQLPFPLLETSVVSSQPWEPTAQPLEIVSEDPREAEGGWGTLVWRPEFVSVLSTLPPHPCRAPGQLLSPGLPAQLCPHAQWPHLLLQQQLSAAGGWQDLQRCVSSHVPVHTHGTDCGWRGWSWGGGRSKGTRGRTDPADFEKPISQTAL